MLANIGRFDPKLIKASESCPFLCRNKTRAVEVGERLQPLELLLRAFEQPLPPSLQLLAGRPWQGAGPGPVFAIILARFSLFVEHHHCLHHSNLSDRANRRLST